MSAAVDLNRRRPGSKRHRDEEAIDARLAITPRAVDTRRSIFLPIENPIITVLARERNGDRNRTKIPVHAVVVGVAVDLVGRQMMGIRGAAARRPHPVGDWPTICPLVVSACRDGGQRSEDRNQTPHTNSRYALPGLTHRPLASLENRNLQVSIPLAWPIVPRPPKHCAPAAHRQAEAPTRVAHPADGAIASTGYPARNCSSKRLTSSGCSCCTQCPAPSTRRAPRH